MPTGKKCDYCEARLYSKIEDFSEYDWTAFKVKNENIRIACPKHKDKLKEIIYEKMMY